LDNHVWIGDFSVVEKATGWSHIGLIRVRDAKNTLVELGSLMVSHLTGLADCLADVTRSEVTHVTDLSAPLRVLVAQKLDTESLDYTLEPLALGDTDYVNLLTGFVYICNGNFATEAILCPLELGIVTSTNKTDLHDFGCLGWHALYHRRLGRDNEANLTEVRVSERFKGIIIGLAITDWKTSSALRWLASFLCISLTASLVSEAWVKAFWASSRVSPNLTSSLHSVWSHVVATNG
jgi:hypothetical protein